MKHQRKEHITNYGGHRAILVVVLCLFGLCLAQSRMAPKKKVPRKKVDERVYLVHADQLTYDMYGRVPGAQILNFSDEGIRSIRYEDTESYQITKLFLERRRQMLDELFKDAEE